MESGKLHILINNQDNGINIWWELLNGSFEKNTWEASVSFTPYSRVPDVALELIFRALEDSSISVIFEPELGRKLECVIHGIDDLFDYGVIEISSSNLGRIRVVRSR
jgi:hypothetical protein